MDLSKIKIRTKNKKSKRRGRGTGSNWGKTAGRGHKGAGQHATKKVPYPGYGGGNLPYLRRFPKRGFNSPVMREYQIVNLKDIQNKLKGTSDITPKALKEVNLVNNENKPVKILADIKNKFTLKATFKVDKVSAKAKQLIEGAGGKTENLKR